MCVVCVEMLSGDSYLRTLEVMKDILTTILPLLNYWLIRTRGLWRDRLSGERSQRKKFFLCLYNWTLQGPLVLINQ